MKSLSKLLSLGGIVVAFALSVSVAEAFAYEVVTKRNIEYVEHDGTRLHGDLYHPKLRDHEKLPVVPVVIAVHGGGWENGAPTSFEHWGPYLAEAGFAVFAIEYRLAKPEQKTYPAAVYDVRAAVQFVRANASSLAIDPDRIALMGDDAGAQLAALVTLANAEPAFSSQYKGDANASTPGTVKAAAVFYGMYDLTAQWQHDQVARPLDQVTQKFLGSSPMANRALYFEEEQTGFPCHLRHIRRSRRRAGAITGV